MGTSWPLGFGRAIRALLSHSRRRRRWDSGWLVAVVLVLSFIVPPAAPALADPPPLLTGIDATLAFTCGERHIHLSGEDLQAGATVKLTRAGEPDLVASEVVLIQMPEPGTLLRCRFDVPPGTAAGLWSVVCTNPDAKSATLVDVLEVVADCPRGAVGDLYVCNTALDNIMQFDGLTGDFVCIFADRPPGTDNNTFSPFDLAWAPNGHLWVISVTDFDNPNSVIEYDGSTGAFIGYVVPPTTPSEGLQDITALSFGGPDGRLYLVSPDEVPGPGPEAKVYGYEDGAPGLPEVVLEPEIVPEPVMLRPRTGRFASNGNYLLLGTSNTIGPPIPTFREFDGQTPDSWPLGFVRDLAIDYGDKTGVVETPDGLFYLVSENRWDRVDRYDIASGQLLDTFIPDLPAPGDEMYEDLRWPWEIAFGPDGNVFVSAEGTYLRGIPPYMDGIDIDGGGVHVFDPVTGEQIGLIGHMDYVDGLTWQPEELLQPHGIEFKPMPGDYASAGGAFGGNWQVDLDDAARLVPALTGPGVTSSDPHSLLSFDAERDGDLDLADFAAFQCAFGATMGN